MLPRREETVLVVEWLSWRHHRALGGTLHFKGLALRSRRCCHGETRLRRSAEIGTDRSFVVSPLPALSPLLLRREVQLRSAPTFRSLLVRCQRALSPVLPRREEIVEWLSWRHHRALGGTLIFKGLAGWLAGWLAGTALSSLLPRRDEIETLS